MDNIQCDDVILLNRGTPDESVIYLRFFDNNSEFNSFIDLLKKQQFTEYYNFYNGCFIHNKTYSVFPVWMFDLYIIIWRSDLALSTDKILAMTRAYHAGASNDD